MIDDEEVVVRLTVSASLRHFRHPVSTAADDEDGIKLFRKQHFDLVITDVRMPGLSYPEIIKVLQNPRLGVPVIIIGGGGCDPEWGRRRERGCLSDDFVHSAQPANTCGAGFEFVSPNSALRVTKSRRMLCLQTPLGKVEHFLDQLAVGTGETTIGKGRSARLRLAEAQVGALDRLDYMVAR